MIELTDEIQRAYAEAWFRAIGLDEDDVERMVAAELHNAMPWRIAALQAVLDIVERQFREAIDSLPSSNVECLVWLRAHRLANNSGIGAVMAAVRADLRKIAGGEGR
jgi:hypothetical protein